MGSGQVDVQVSSFDTAGATVIRHGSPLACASLLKPVYVRAGGDSGVLTLSERSAIITSSNTATGAVIALAGGLEMLLPRVQATTGVRLEPAMTFGTVAITAEQAARTYQALLVDGSPRAEAVRSCMRRVRAAQQLGTRAVWAKRRGVSIDRVGVKCGWDLTDDGCLLTHAALMDDTGGAVVLTRTAVAADIALRWRRALLTSGPSGPVLNIHTITAGPALFTGLRQAAEELSC